MCIMEVRAGQRSSTIAQACAHNVTTVERDCDMFATLLEARGDGERLVALRRAQYNLEHAYADLLELFGEYISEEEAEHGRHHDHDDGTSERELPVSAETHAQQHERSLVEIAHHDASLARRYETR